MLNLNLLTMETAVGRGLMNNTISVSESSRRSFLNFIYPPLKKRDYITLLLVR